MRETTQLVAPRIEMLLAAELPSEFSCGALRESVLYYWSTRKHHLLSRAHLSRILLNLFTQQSWKDHLDLLALPELINIAFYQANLALDRTDLPPDENHSTQFLCSSMTSCAVYSRISRCASLGIDARSMATSIFAEASRHVALGQYLDLNVLRLSALTNTQDDEFANAYYQRCCLMGGGTFEACVLPALADCVTLEILHLIVRLLILYGACSQVQNDVANVVDAIAKGRHPSDLANNKLTLSTRQLCDKGVIHPKRPLEVASYLEQLDPQQRKSVVQRTILAARLFIRERLWPEARYVTRKLRGLVKRDLTGSADPFDWVPAYFFSTKHLRCND